MAYQKKYYFEFKQLHTDNDNVVEIWQNTGDVLIAESVIGMSSPFIVELNELDHKFQAVVGHGCSVSMFSESDRKFLDGLYHVDPKEFIVYHYIDGALNFVGYLNSEMYMESYSDQFNYGISITGNDGIALSDRFTFLTDLDEKYTGLKTEFEVLMICLNKIGLPWTELRISLGTTFTGYSDGASVTILHETYVNSANFYDEDDYPMTIREVLTSILAPYGAQLFCQDGYVYISDINGKVEGIDTGFVTPPTFKRYNYSTEIYISDIGIANRKIIQSIGYSGTGQSIEISGGVNKQVVAYSPYVPNQVLPEALVGLDEFSGIPVDWTAREGYFYKILTGNQYFNMLVTPTIGNFESSYYEGIVNGESASGNTDGYLRFVSYQPYTDIIELIDGPYVSISSQAGEVTDETRSAGIVINFDVLLTYTDSEVYYYLIRANSGYVYGVRLYFKVSIGNLFYDGETEAWVADSSKTFFVEFLQMTREKWIAVEKLIRVGDETSDIVLSGDLDFKVTSRIEILRKTGSAFNPDWYWEWWNPNTAKNAPMIWLKNLSITTKNANNLDIPDDDIEYVGILDERFKEEGQKITLTTGTDTYSVDRAKMMYNDGSNYKSIEEWTRAGQTYKIEELLLNSLVSNYRFGFFKLNNFVLRQDFTFFNVFTDNNISDKVFTLKAAKIDYEMNEIECSMWEMSPDRLTIVK